MRTAPNPRAPTFEEAMREALAPAEIDALVAHLRPLYEAKQGIVANAFAYLYAIKSSVATPKPAIHGHVKTGHFQQREDAGFYSYACG